MRDPRGRFVSEKPKFRFWAMTCVLVVFVLSVGIMTGHLSVTWKHPPMSYSIDEELVSKKTFDREEWMAVAAAGYKQKCQHAWKILHDDPRDGRKAFKVLDE